MVISDQFSAPHLCPRYVLILFLFQFKDFASSFLPSWSTHFHPVKTVSFLQILSQLLLFLKVSQILTIKIHPSLSRLRVWTSHASLAMLCIFISIKHALTTLLSPQLFLKTVGNVWRYFDCQNLGQVRDCCWHLVGRTRDAVNILQCTDSHHNQEFSIPKCE